MMKGSSEHGETSKAPLSRGVSKGVSVLDLILRFIAIIGTLASAIAMGTTNETLPFFTQFIRFKAQYSDLPTLTIHVSQLVTWFILGILLQAMLALVTAGASAAAAIVYLAHKGNVRANWFAICQQFDSFCERISGSLIGSFAAMVVLVLLILLSAIALARH
ncbi:hypothetical protein PR202_gn00545 [Eleusine coracana subsp. coracana]|uniref:CASP-like protein n=1 Tax=Eleusine coracana subsp. coracana TaxID=191504 RepID=A0AAV5G3Y8_ELECO|nr:hypothetical protein PR202_gn00545 [Eleusine coracana subsp. coracana]